MLSFLRNNLDRSLSPYLQQHKSNPIHWQEWGEEVLAYALKEGKPIFLSIGYAACHWCHVMAAEAFEDDEIAGFLNAHFVSIKLDREQRPDIDQYFMEFMTRTTGQGGWPLNCFLTPDRTPLIAMTYVPVESIHGNPSFIEVIKEVLHAVEGGIGDGGFSGKLGHFRAPDVRVGSLESDILPVIIEKGDELFGGFGFSQKFPPHSTLLFLLGYLGSVDGEIVGSMSADRGGKGHARTAQKITGLVMGTLDAMQDGGIQDHLQGGFFRYCTDRGWKVPHYEKMLYDQAMLLWIYCSAFKLLRKEGYRRTALSVVKCLEESFGSDGLFYSSHDADSDHEEGGTYLWAVEELRSSLTEEEFRLLDEVYFLSDPESLHADIPGKIHLIKRKGMGKGDLMLERGEMLDSVREIEGKLLAIRKRRVQPCVDMKLLTSWNALTGVALVMGWRFLGLRECLNKAKRVFSELIERHLRAGSMAHSSFGGRCQNEGFLEDYASMLVLSTFLYEETGEYKEWMEFFSGKTLSFKRSNGSSDGTANWIEGDVPDFMEVPASVMDLPTPSSASLAEVGLWRMKILLGGTSEPLGYKRPLYHDFFNSLVLASGGACHIIHSPEKINWDVLPLNSIQVRSGKIQDCFKERCMEFETVESLVKSFGISCSG